MPTIKRAIIVDDEQKSVEVLKTLVTEFIDGLEIVGTANDIAGGISIIEQTKPDIAFLDITLKEGDSFQILKKLDKIDFDVVFITAYDEFTVRALRYSGIHCLYKPIDLMEFENTLNQLHSQSEQTIEAIEMARQLLQSKFTRIPVITQKGLIYVSPEQINYLESLNNSSIIYFNDYTTLHTDRPVSDLAAVLEGAKFVFLWNELLLNLNNVVVEKTKPGKVVFQSGAELKLEAELVNKILKLIGK